MPEALEKRWIHILRTMRTEVHKSHEQDKVEEQPPMRDRGAAEPAPGGLALCFPNLALFHVDAHEQRKQRRKAAQQEHRPPAQFSEQEKITERGEKVSQSV